MRSSQIIIIINLRGVVLRGTWRTRGMMKIGLKFIFVPRASLCSSARHERIQTAVKVFGRRQRCHELASLHEEYFVTSMIDVLLSRSKVQHAEPVFNRYRREGHQFHVRVYNQMMDAWIRQGNEVKATLLFNTMTDDGVSPDYTTYAILLCHLSNEGNIDSIKELVRDMEEKGYTVSHLPYKAYLEEKQMATLVKLLEDLQIKPLKPSRGKGSYSSLVQPIYEMRKDSKVSPLIPQMHVTLGADSFQEKIQSQLDIEKNGYTEIASIAKPVAAGNEKVSNTLNSLYSQWEEELMIAIDKELQEYEVSLKTIEEKWFSPRHISKYLPFLACLSARQWAQIAVEQVIKNAICQPDGQPVYYLCRSLLGPAYRKYVIEQKQKRGIARKIESIYQDFINFALSNDQKSHTFSREFWQEQQENNYLNGTVEACVPYWPNTVGIYVGSALIDIILQTLKLPDDQIGTNNDSMDSTGNDTAPPAAFDHVYEFQNGKQTGYLRPHPSLYALFRRLHSKAEPGSFRMDTCELPMLVPPCPWSNVNEGGYLLTPSSIVRSYGDTYQHQLLLEASDNMSPVLDSLNYLSLCPWMVNERMLDLAIYLFNNGGDESLDVPPTDLPEIPDIPPNCDEDTRKKILRKRKAVKKLHRENFSLRMDMLYKLSMSNHYRDTIFWLPHNMDFRSRVYPIPPHITHLSSDLSRSLIQFGMGYPLGKRGLEWLKIHLANLHGAKSKSSLEERLKFTESMIPEIKDSADKPFEGNCWWKTADEPWQTLACCMELTQALRSGDPENYISHLPIHQDGSCNGLQHYAAMGRDLYGAKQVNLIPLDMPANLYAEVALLVDKRRKDDAEKGKEIAQLLEGKVNRKVVKQTVMTVVYGVTWVGGRLQIEKQLDGNIADEHLYSASSYLVEQVFDSLKEMFSNARSIQDWLASSARMIALSGHPVEWITPLGMPVVQPYHKPVSKEYHSRRLQGVTQVNTSDFSRPPNSVKQKMAMPPNFVHSLDSTHMMLTALHCQRAGIPFVAVHDSYWTHAAFVDGMNKICREQFIALHSQPILNDLATFFENKFGGLSFYDHGSKWTKGKPGWKVTSFMEELPSQGELQLDCVMDSTYFFS